MRPACLLAASYLAACVLSTDRRKLGRRSRGGVQGGLGEGPGREAGQGGPERLYRNIYKYIRVYIYV